MTTAVGTPPPHTSPADRVRGGPDRRGDRRGADRVHQRVHRAERVADRRLFAPGAVRAGTFDPWSLPYERVPALVKQAHSAPGVGAPESWQVTAESLTGSPTVRVVATGGTGTGTVVANVDGVVIQQ